MTLCTSAFGGWGSHYKPCFTCEWYYLHFLLKATVLTAPSTYPTMSMAPGIASDQDQP